ncbi:MAG: DUF4476 domain-containing protein [Chitinophagaceae bacterium]|nr:DUF4476 domain-containing protein [Chitinophagaceae bacterium]
MKKLSLTAILLSAFISVYAQFQPSANLTIFSEDGLRFFLILNGERMNEVAQTNIRIEELPQPYYSCKIIFEDPQQKEITKNVLMLTDAEGVMQDVVYKIKRDKNGKNILRFFSQQNAVQNLPRPGNCTVYRFGSLQPIFSPGGVNAQTTTTTVRTQTQTNNPGVNIDVNGNSLRFEVNDGMGGANTTTTTTRTTTTQTTTRTQTMEPDYIEMPVDGGPTNPCRGYFMSQRDFEQTRGLLNGESFENNKLDIAKQAISAKCMNTQQIIQVCKLFSFENNKLDFAKFAYAYCSDPENYFKVNSVFTFSSSKSELNQFLQSAR